jgi:hypothetical protein
LHTAATPPPLWTHHPFSTIAAHFQHTTTFLTQRRPFSTTTNRFQHTITSFQPPPPLSKFQPPLAPPLFDTALPVFNHHRLFQVRHTTTLFQPPPPFFSTHHKSPTMT